jgi:DNA-binding CsgD family transcriptional regulator
MRPLNGSEKKTLALLAQGKNNAEIAEALGITIGTAKNYTRVVHASSLTPAATRKP